MLTLFRGYDPEMGRRLSTDPIGEERGLNLYGYVGGNPLSLIDPLGLESYGLRLNYGPSGPGPNIAPSPFFKWLGISLGITRKAVGNIASGRCSYSGAPSSTIGAGITKTAGAVIGPVLKAADMGPDMYNAVDKIAGQKQTLKAMIDYCESDGQSEDSNEKLKNIEKNGPKGIWIK